MATVDLELGFRDPIGTLQPAAAQTSIDFIWLELTAKCNLECVHCYADSSPNARASSLTTTDWIRLITEAKVAGARRVQFIGGEPTIHPDFLQLVRFAAQSGLEAEVFTNLLRITPAMWDLFQQCHVSLATSFYSIDAKIHDTVTTRPGSHRRTFGNIERALRLGLHIRVGIIKVFEDQDISETYQRLRGLGIEHITVDGVRGVGRGADDSSDANQIDSLCGHCATSRVAIDPYGNVHPCVFSRWLTIGDVHSHDVGELIRSEAMDSIRSELETAFARRSHRMPDHEILMPAACLPSGCNPQFCIPNQMCGPLTNPPRPPSPCPPRA